MLYILKKGDNNFWHRFNNNAKEVNASKYDINLDIISQTVSIQMPNGSNIPANAVSVLNVIVIDETSGSIEETFTNVTDLRNRLVELGYSPYNTGGGSIPNLTQVLAQGNREIKPTEDETYNTIAGDETKLLISAGTVTFNIIDANHPVGSVIKIIGTNCYVTSDLAINGIEGTIPRFVPLYNSVELTKIDEGSGWVLNYISTKSNDLFKQIEGIPFQDGDSNILSLGAGPTINGVSYQITDNTGLDVINCGAPNNNVGTYFIANGNTPTSWGTGTLSYDEGAPVLKILSNTLGNTWFTVSAGGEYYWNSEDLFVNDKTIVPYAYYSAANGYEVSFERINSSQILIRTRDSGVLAKGVLTQISNWFSILLKVYL